MEKEEFLKLIQTYLDGQAMPEEEQMLLHYFESFQNNDPWDEAILGPKSVIGTTLFHRLSTAISSHQNKKESVVSPIHRIHFLRAAWFRYAAILLLVAGTIVFLYQHNQPKQELAIQQPTDFQPGGNKAILTLADGSKIVLDSAGNGMIAQQGAVGVKKQGDLLSYASPTEKSGADSDLYNMLSTPRGGQYKVVLPDGTKVWLNAASSIKYPTRFTDKERTVAITGEVYFEVTKVKDTRGQAVPFSVTTGKATIQVLGTSFNINAYNDEETQRTTLISGSVKIVADNSQAVLKPGEAATTTGKKIKVTKGVDIDRALAWKNGLFNFNGVGVKEAMNQLARWYDLEIVYEHEIPSIKFEGKMTRDVPLSDVLTSLQVAGVRFKMENGRKLIVLSSEPHQRK